VLVLQPLGSQIEPRPVAPLAAPASRPVQRR